MSMPLPDSVRRGAIAPTIVTSSPSRIQTVPRPMTILQWKRDHGRRSMRAGMLVRIVFIRAAATLIVPAGGSLEVDAPLSRAGPSVPLLERRPDDALGVPARLRCAWLEAVSD